MRIIPVIDISQGQVVHAIAGQREHYRPVCSRLSPGSDPVNIVQAFLDLYSFDTVYIADLDAITGKPPNHACLYNLLNRYPRLNFWLDQGASNAMDMRKSMHARVRHVLGSETNFSAALLPELIALSPQPVLSLDFKGGNLLGDQKLLQQPQDWPDNIIFLDLDRVGSTCGVDAGQLGKILQITRHSEVFSGGGIRDAADLRGLQNSGVAGALVATALHEGKITFADLQALARG